jgi:hypothetical protein
VVVVESQNLGRWRVGHSLGRLGFGCYLGLGPLDGVGTQPSAMVFGLSRQALVKHVGGQHVQNAGKGAFELFHW